jgi:hypothetical protein
MISCWHVLYFTHRKAKQRIMRAFLYTPLDPKNRTILESSTQNIAKLFDRDAYPADLMWPVVEKIAVISEGVWVLVVFPVVGMTFI